MATSGSRARDWLYPNHVSRRQGVAEGRVAVIGGVDGMEAVVKPPVTDSRRPPIAAARRGAGSKSRKLICDGYNKKQITIGLSALPINSVSQPDRLGSRAGRSSDVHVPASPTVIRLCGLTQKRDVE